MQVVEKHTVFSHIVNFCTSVNVTISILLTVLLPGQKLYEKSLLDFLQDLQFWKLLHGILSLGLQVTKTSKYPKTFSSETFLQQLFPHMIHNFSAFRTATVQIALVNKSTLHTEVWIRSLQ